LRNGTTRRRPVRVAGAGVWQTYWFRTPDESEARTTRLRLSGVGPARLQVTLAGPEGCTSQEDWDAAAGALTLAVTHNGPVNISVRFGPAR
jgi:hypothetical protein